MLLEECFSSSFCRVSYVCEWIGCSISWVATSELVFVFFPRIGVFVFMEPLQIHFGYLFALPCYNVLGMLSTRRFRGSETNRTVCLHSAGSPFLGENAASGLKQRSMPDSKVSISAAFLGHSIGT
jgi:hypothetical protein